ncbi:hypothetical protein [Chryseobacterium sp. SL1]|uniref:hypothetical protein n=1 Tax=Chryseobacterium sp. SL1 TaxID=2995159 RepID=UPI00227397AD|nr:hypothetical protein [Chryseobacterium sp. SL1]MCY1660918.1 hypothetical protein [Chryseobacterium sp. SL1]
MGNMGKGGVYIEPDSVRRMKIKTDELAENLSRTSKDLFDKTEDLNRTFQDKNFRQLGKVMTDNKGNMDRLKEKMSEFSCYLEEVEKLIRSYLGDHPLQGKGITI